MRPKFIPLALTDVTLVTPLVLWLLAVGAVVGGSAKSAALVLIAAGPPYFGWRIYQLGVLSSRGLIAVASLRDDNRSYSQGWQGTYEFAHQGKTYRALVWRYFRGSIRMQETVLFDPRKPARNRVLSHLLTASQSVADSGDVDDYSEQSDNGLLTPRTPDS